LIYGSSTSGLITVNRTVPFVSASIGGVAGEVFDGSVVSSSSSAKVNGKDGAAVGGLVGGIAAFNSGSLVMDSYATGSVKMGDTRNDRTVAGGLIASVSTGNVTVSESYATGNVSGGRGRMPIMAA
jgi:trimeric autotransporter adhesin